MYIYIYIYFFALCRLPYRVARPNMSMSVFSCTVRSSSLKVSRPNCGRPDLASTSKANLTPTTRYCVSQHPETTISTAHCDGTKLSTYAARGPVIQLSAALLCTQLCRLHPSVDTPEAVHLICHAGRGCCIAPERANQIKRHTVMYITVHESWPWLFAKAATNSGHS